MKIELYKPEDTTLWLFCRKHKKVFLGDPFIYQEEILHEKKERFEVL